ncbi:MAG: iron-containing alcohol dehydrogenase [Treponema sp.]|nr:iron-containing alcohol dehydrogenase [Treponema sp.]
MADLTFRISPNIVLGSFTTSRLGQFALAWGKKYMLIVDPVLKELGTTEKITSALTDRGIDFFIFDAISETAETKTVDQALTLARQAHVQGVIAAGGGKTLHIARAVCALYNSPVDVYDFIEGRASPETEPLALICIPTTSRDSFIFTDIIPLIDSRSRRITIAKTQQGLCKLALFDPNLTVTLSEKQIGAMTQEVICLAAEAYLSQKANFFSDMISEKTMELLGYALDENHSLTITTPQNELLAQSGCMASLAAATSAIGPASLLALSINARYKVSRALTTSILLPHMLETCAGFKADRIANLMTHIQPESARNSTEECVQSLIELTRQRLAKLNLPARLKDLALSMEQLTQAAEDAAQLPLMNTMPRSMTGDDLFELIKKAF